MLNLSNILEDSARTYPKKSAFIFGDTHLNYETINKKANQVANGLKKIGIEKGDKVALNCLNLPYFPIVYFGILKVGGVVVPLSVLLKEDEVAYHLKDSKAKICISFEGTAQLPMGEHNYEGFKKVDSCQDFYMITSNPEGVPTIKGVKTLNDLTRDQSTDFETIQTTPEDTAIIIYTSGTTGNPKGAELTHSNLLLNAIVCSEVIGTKNEDIQLIVLPLFHIFAMTALMNSGIYKGATSVLLPRFDALSVLNLMQQYSVSIFAGVPTMYWGLVSTDTSNYDIKNIGNNLKVCVSGGASLPVKILEDFESKFNAIILEGYGMSEGSPVVTFNQLAVGRKRGSIGTPAWGVEVKIVDDKGNEIPVGEKGELIYRGHNVMKGYYNKPEATSKALKNGWLYSGDVAIKDEDGFFFIVDRTKDMIIRGGLNVYPREVEEVMMRHTSISMVAVVGTPDNQYGEEVKAFVVLKDKQELSEETLIQWTKEKIAAYKYPRSIEFVNTLPMSATGKILKKELRNIDKTKLKTK
ncbi:long-chain acyl-CoA synthetase [Tenacibaculum sp. MAR_2009_124]|uniref:long-chain-fatty-acid--CoA ligase n=1 Tax=Tenacibaculum sp. MAR_2009_124 TaxID=1250059 RepID=UPI00089D6CE9|nr:long-chain fatty acid--CoA ligase [Tenacibaculum sp. MAR_2009_124]SEB45384.1 long-chain acyl-CoA synthetase [Tenacibaculum sp. MAR_2009_124]